MSWFRLDDRGAFHDKVVAAGNEAYGAWCRAGQWSSGRGTEGFIPTATARLIAPERVWRKLTEAKGSSTHGLVEPVEGGYQIHDFLDYNPTAEEAEAKRAARAEAGRRGGLRSAAARTVRRPSPPSKPPSNGEANAQAIAEANAKQNSTPIPIPIPIPIPEIPQNTLSGVLSPAPSEAKPKQKPAKKFVTAMPEGFAVSAQIEEICRREGLPDPHAVLPDFRDKALAKAYRYADWEAAFRSWMRSPITRERYEPWATTDPTKGQKPLPPMPQLELGPAPGREVTEAEADAALEAELAELRASNSTDMLREIEREDGWDGGRP